MDFKKKDVSEVGQWLKEENFNDTIVESFKSKLYLATSSYLRSSSFLYVDNDIDGEAFMMLED